MEETRTEIREFGITEKDILEDGVERRVKAYYPPSAPVYSLRVFSFLKSNEAHVMVAGGMQHFALGFDKSKLAFLAPSYGIEFERIIPFVHLYETEFLKKQQRSLDKT